MCDNFVSNLDVQHIPHMSICMSMRLGAIPSPNRLRCAKQYKLDMITEANALVLGVGRGLSC